MRIAYLLEEPAISATTRIIAAQTNALLARGHDVRIVDELQGFVPAHGEIVVPAHSDVVQKNPIVADGLFREKLPRENNPLRVLIAGASQTEAKGIGEAYGAAAHARWFHQTLELVRVSPWAPSREEPLDDVQEFHVALSESEMSRLMHSCDVVVAGNRREDPLSLTTLEALASGLVCVLTNTDAHQALGAGAALFAPVDNAVELGEKLIEVLEDRDLRQRLRTRGREVAEQFRAANVVTRLESLLASKS